MSSSCLEYYHAPGVAFTGGRAEVREQRDEHQAVQLLAAPLLASQFHGRFHVVPAVCR